MFAPNPRGVGKALSSLFKHLVPLMPDSKITFYTNRPGELRCGEAAQTRWIDIRGDRFNTWENVRLPLASLTERINLLHCPSQTAPPLTPCPVVLTVHDLIPLRMDDGWSAVEVNRFRKALTRSITKSRRIITVSEFTKRDLMAFCRLSEDKVDVVHWGVDKAPSSAFDEDKWQSFCRRVGIVSPYFIAFGGDAPRKNVTGVLQALARFIREVSRDVQLLLVGVPDEVKEKFKAAAGALDLSGSVVQLGYLPDELIRQALTRSEALVYPSLYEGFGLPILEAMVAGAPVITSNVTSMPEIAGDAALLVDPVDPGAIADAMHECFTNRSLRAELKARAFRRIDDFSWELAAHQTLASYSKALN